MNRWLAFFICIVAGMAALLCGWLMPVHLRAVDACVVALAGKNTPTPQLEKFPAAAFTNSSEIPMEAQPFTDFMIRSANREKTLARLSASENPGVRELLRCRLLTNTLVFSPSPSASGQAFDAALGIAGVLLDENKLTAHLSNSVITLAGNANQSGKTGQLEPVLLDFMSLGQRMNYVQLATFVRHIETIGTLNLLTDEVRTETNLPTIFAAIQASENSEGVADYLARFSQSGMSDLKTSFRYGTGGVRELIRRKERLYVSNFPVFIAPSFCLRNPELALTVKWILYLAAGFLLVLALHYARPPASGLERPLQVRGFHFAREILFALGFLLVVLLLSEPFLAQESQKGVMPFRLRLPGVGVAAPVENAGKLGGFMNQSSLLTMLLFFVLQALLYTASLVKLAEIRRQSVPPRMKLKLLENEEHLFDSGLYLGFLGTIVSLILVSLGVFKQPSLMAAYSSTSFGILFVVLFKVVHLRPARRKLLLEAELAPPPTETVTPTHQFATPL